jgi:hypothetical protein
LPVAKEQVYFFMHFQTKFEISFFVLQNFYSKIAAHFLELL